MIMINSLAAMPLPQLKKAIAIREKIETLTTELDELMQSHGFASMNDNGAPLQKRETGVHKMRGTTQHFEWPSRNGATNGSNGHAISKKPRLSAAGRAKVSAAVKARWARFRAAKARAARAK
jgi:hypothetical protein